MNSVNSVCGKFFSFVMAALLASCSLQNSVQVSEQCNDLYSGIASKDIYEVRKSLSRSMPPGTPREKIESCLKELGFSYSYLEKELHLSNKPVIYAMKENFSRKLIVFPVYLSFKFIFNEEGELQSYEANALYEFI